MLCLCLFKQWAAYLIEGNSTCKHSRNDLSQLSNSVVKLPEAHTCLLLGRGCKVEEDQAGAGGRIISISSAAVPLACVNGVLPVRTLGVD